MNKNKALNLAIFAINTLQHPDASTADDAAILDSQADEAIVILACMRKELKNEHK